MSTNNTVNNMQTESQSETFERYLQSVREDYKNIQSVPNPATDKHADLTTEQYYTICSKAIAQNSNAYKLIKDPTYDISIFVIKQSSYIFRDIKLQTPCMCLIAVQNDGLSLSNCRWQSPEICLEETKKTGIALGYVMEQFMTFEVCVEAVKDYGDAIKDIPINVMNKFGPEQSGLLCMEAVTKSCSALKYINFKTPALCIQALKTGIGALQYFSKDMINSIGKDVISQLCIEHFKKSPYAISSIKNPSFELCLESVKHYGSSIREIKDGRLSAFTTDQIHQLYKEAINNTKNSYLTIYLSDSVMARFNKKQIYELYVGLAKNAYGLSSYLNKMEDFSKEEIYELQMIAVKHNGNSLYYIKEQTLELCIEAVKQNYKALGLISKDVMKELIDNSAFMELCIEAVKQDSNALSYFLNGRKDSGKIAKKDIGP